jgi:hypothetical protein
MGNWKEAIKIQSLYLIVKSEGNAKSTANIGVL